MQWYEEYGFGSSIAQYPTTVKRIGTWIPDILAGTVEDFVDFLDAKILARQNADYYRNRAER